MQDLRELLTPERALIFRILHIDNVPWVLEYGLHCRNSTERDPNFHRIGNAELIGKRHTRAVDVGPGGTLSDYVPFYFTPASPMLYNIKTGYGGVTQVANDDIVFIVTSLHKIAATGIEFVFTDRHAYPKVAEYCVDLADLGMIDWPILQRRDFSKDPEDPGKLERYQAEALVYQHVPVDALLGLACYNDTVEAQLKKELAARDLDLKLEQRAWWYF